ncbi:MAG TPA: helix-turn-helix domain-containing protein [Terracidiphilus sp.]|jgi:transcriptional regulator with XRE-family HTH domain
MKTRGPDPLAVYSIALKLRALRAEKRLTLVRLATETRLSTALLSKLETGKMDPTLTTLEKICHVYGIGLGHFFCEPKQHSLSITRKSHLRDRERPGAKVTPLHLPTADGKLVSKLIELPPGAPSTTGTRGARTELTAYVLEGTLRLSFAGSEEVLEQGDVVVVDTDQMLIWSAAGDSLCRILTVSVK